MLTPWLYMVSALQAMVVGGVFLRPQVLLQRLFPLMPGEASPLHARTFATWVATVCILTLATAYESPHPRSGLFLACLLSFFLLIGHFSTELIVFNTMSMGSFAAIFPFVVAGISVGWMSFLFATAAPRGAKALKQKSPVAPKQKSSARR